MRKTNLDIRGQSKNTEDTAANYDSGFEKGIRFGCITGNLTFKKIKSILILWRQGIRYVV